MLLVTGQLRNAHVQHLYICLDFIFTVYQSDISTCTVTQTCRFSIRKWNIICMSMPTCGCL